MKKYLLLFAAIAMATSASAQFYVSGTGGYAIGSAGVLMGTSLNADQSEATNHYGSYGEGANYQIRTGYMFNDTFGVELGVGYLHGANQNKDSYVQNEDGSFKEVTDAIAYGRAYGLTASLVYKFTKSIYGRFGALTKIGGKTVAEFTKNTTTPFGPIVSVGEQDFHGRFPLGFNAALGYTYKLSDHFNLFAELEYLGIQVTRDYSEFKSLTIDYPAVPAGSLGGGQPAQTIPAGTWNLGDAPLNHPVYGTIYAPSKITYVDTLSTSNQDPSKALSETVPYSSFGINFGITYTFGSKKEAKTN
jgi:hypothetical protein